MQMRSASFGFDMCYACRAPKLLTVHLKRFRHDGRGRLSKVRGHIGFDFELDLTPFCDPQVNFGHHLYQNHALMHDGLRCPLSYGLCLRMASQVLLRLCSAGSFHEAHLILPVLWVAGAARACCRHTWEAGA